MEKNFPKTFELPTILELKKIEKGDSAKICLKRERFWTKVTKVDGDKIEATVDNDLFFVTELKYNDKVSFEKKNIYSIILNKK